MRWMGILGFSIVIVACGARTELGDERPHSPLCGNGVIDPGEACDLGAANSDASPTFAITQNGQTFVARPLAHEQSATSFYDYFSASSHTGLEEQGESRIYLYLDEKANALSLVVNHNIDGQGDGQASMRITGLPHGFNIDLSDDKGELAATDATTADGHWQWSENSDGGVIGGLCASGWTIVATPTFTSGIATWVWVDGDESRKPLDRNGLVTIAPRPQCHTDCTLVTSCE